MSLKAVRLTASACGAMGRTPSIGRSKISMLGGGVSEIRNKFAPLSTAAQPATVCLPHLPVPPLQITLQKYLRTVRPLLSDAEFAQTEQVVQDFDGKGKLGEKLQFLLEEKARRCENWLAEWWLNTAYMEYRSPVVVFSSPGLVFPFQKVFSKDDQLRYAAKLIYGALGYKNLIDENALPVERMGTKPLDMSQYLKVMSTCRIPGVTKDSIIHYGLQSQPPTHIVVAHNNHFFKVNVYTESGEVLSEVQILQQLKEIVAQSVESAKPVGILTSNNRNVWGQVYSKLIKDKQNQHSLEEIQKSIFLVCIDNPNPNVETIRKEDVAAMQMIHGLGSIGNGGNRWYDKTIQFIIGANGEMGLTYEHSPAEGPPIANLMDHIIKYISEGKESRTSSGNAQKPERLSFNLNPEILSDIKNSQQALDKLVADLEMSCGTTKVYGKNLIKSHKMSPDSYFQMAIQLAFYRIHGKPGACYESASTRQYIHGRTETIRSTSIESLTFCKTMLSSASDGMKVQSLRAAVESHKKYTLEAVAGFGVDRHLLGLKLTAIENGLDVPQLYLDKGFLTSTHFRLSTSQVPSKYEAFMCYAPLVADGYACCYNPQDNQISFGIGAFKSCSETSAREFHSALEQSLIDMHDVLVRAQGSKL